MRSLEQMGNVKKLAGVMAFVNRLLQCEDACHGSDILAEKLLDHQFLSPEGRLSSSGRAVNRIDRLLLSPELYPIL